MQILQVHFQDYIPEYHIFVEQKDDVDKLVQHWQEPTTLWDGQLVIGLAETYLDDLETVGFREAMTFGMAPWHLVSETDRHKEALVSQSPIAVFKACNMLQALGAAYSKIVLPGGDSKGESKNRTHCPATWNYSYKRTHAAEFSDQARQVGASALLCKECTLVVIAQLSKKSAIHPNCAFADSASTVMSGAMISLTPCIEPTIDRQPALNEYAEFKDADDMIQQLNSLLSMPHGFPQIPAPRKACQIMRF